MGFGTATLLHPNRTTRRWRRRNCMKQVRIRQMQDDPSAWPMFVAFVGELNRQVLESGRSPLLFRFKSSWLRHASDGIGVKSIPVFRSAANDIAAPFVKHRWIRRQRSHRERPARVTVNEEADESSVVGEVAEVGREELAGVLAHGGSEEFSVFKADAEGKERAAVADDGVIGRGVELACKLVAQRQAESILAGFGKHDRCRWRRQRLELVEIEVMIAAL